MVRIMKLSSIFLIAIVVVFCGAGFPYKRMTVDYRNLYDTKCYFKADEKTINFSFIFVNSYLTIIDYKLVEKRKDGTKEYFLTLIGKYFKKIEDAPTNSNIKRINGRFELILKVDLFDIEKDKWFYKDNTTQYQIKVCQNQK